MEYLDAIVDTVVLRDVVERFGVRNTVFLRNLVRFCADSVGTLLSAKRASDYLKTQHLSVSPQIVIDYLSHLEAAFLIHRCHRYDIQGRKLFEIGEKIYFEDLGLRTALRGFRQGDLGKIIENAIYLKLLQDGWTVSVGVLGDREIDSVGTRGDAIVYIQAATIIANEETRQREFGNLLKIDDTIPSTLSAWIRSARMTAGYVIWACASFSCWKRNQNRGRHAPLSLHRHAAFTRTWLAAKSRQKS